MPYGKEGEPVGCLSVYDMIHLQRRKENASLVPTYPLHMRLKGSSNGLLDTGALVLLLLADDS